MSPSFPPPAPILGTPAVPPIAVTWNAATSSTTDNVGRHAIQLDITPAPAADFWLEFEVPPWGPVVAGTSVGEYDFDYRLVGPYGPAIPARGLNRWKVRIHGGTGSTTVQLQVEINENLDPSETYALTIKLNGFYTIGANATHTVTCTRGHLNIPSASNTGAGILRPLNPTEISDWQSSAGSRQLLDRKVTYECQPNHQGCLLENDWIKGGSASGTYPATSHVYNQAGQSSDGTKIRYCTVGGAYDQVANNNRSGLVMRSAMPAPGWEVEFCHVFQLGNDGMKSLVNSNVHDCYVHQCGGHEGDQTHFGSGDTDSHADFLQYEGFSIPILTRVHHNSIYMPSGSQWSGAVDEGTDAVNGWRVSSLMQLDCEGEIDDRLLIYSNWMDGGGNYMFTFKSDFEGDGHWLSMEFRNNRFGIQRRTVDASLGDDAMMAQALQSIIHTEHSEARAVKWRGMKWGGLHVPDSYQSRPIYGLNNAPAFD